MITLIKKKMNGCWEEEEKVYSDTSLVTYKDQLAWGGIYS